MITFSKFWQLLRTGGNPVNAHSVGPHDRVNEATNRTRSTSLPLAMRYDDLDRRLIDTFPASDAVARY